VGSSYGSWSKIFDSGRVGSTFCCSGRVSHIWFEFGKFLLRIPRIPNFSNANKKISLGQFKKYLCQRPVCLLFSAGQKYTQVRSGPISSGNSCLGGGGGHKAGSARLLRKYWLGAPLGGEAHWPTVHTLFPLSLSNSRGSHYLYLLYFFAI